MTLIELLMAVCAFGVLHGVAQYTARLPVGRPKREGP